MRLKACMLAALLAAPVAAQDAYQEPLTIEATELRVFDRATPDNRYGPLTFLGGLDLNSSHRSFEGLSGLTMIGDTLLIVTDQGNWLRATLENMPDGRPVGVRNAVISALLDADGEPIGSKRMADAEAIDIIGNEVWVSSERNRPLRAYALTDNALTGPARLPFGAEPPLPSRDNLGPEAMVHVTEGPLAGETLVFLEEPPRQAANPTAARLTASGEVLRFAVQRQEGFAITGAAMMPGGDIVIVERRFSWGDGIFMRLKLLPAAEIANGAVQGRLLLHADGATLIDNMEGIAVSPHENGPIITLISDDNGNFFQRTVLLRFQITEDLSDLAASTPPAPVARPGR